MSQPRNRARFIDKTKRPGTGMPSIAKTDTSNMASKVAIRLWLLQKMGISEAYVLDTCSGMGHIWEAMQEHISVRQWTRCDIKPRTPGVLKMDATETIERMPIDTYNVVDIDPYGEPWEPYLALLKRITKPTAVFLTACQLGGRSTVSRAACEAAGVPADWQQRIPKEAVTAGFIHERTLQHTADVVTVLHAARLQLGNDTKYDNLSKAQKVERGKARNAVETAVGNGSLPRVSACACVDCGQPAGRYDHHAGYDKEHWLDVQPVCYRCDGKRSARRGEHKGGRALVTYYALGLAPKGE